MTRQLNFPLGLDTNNNIVHLDISEAPHILVGGTTGSGKSSFLHSIICSLLMKITPDELNFLMIDTKMVELTSYDGIPNLISDCVTDAYEAFDYLNALVGMMESRYLMLQEFGAKSLPELNNKLSHDNKIPYILLVVDEIADLMMISKHKVEESIVRLGQKGRACGIHMVLATQTPRREVISGVLKSNLPTRIAFSTASELDSRIIINCNGAAQLLGHGDALFSDQGRKPIRLQTPYISSEEIINIVNHLYKKNHLVVTV